MKQKNLERLKGAGVFAAAALALLALPPWAARPRERTGRSGGAPTGTGSPGRQGS